MITCHYCKKEILDVREITKDHVIPKSKGGKDNASNIVPCCHRCNAEKGNRSYEYFVKFSNLRNKRRDLTLSEAQDEYKSLLEEQRYMDEVNEILMMEGLIIKQIIRQRQYEQNNN